MENTNQTPTPNQIPVQDVAQVKGSNKFLEKIKPFYDKFDLKLTGLVPDPKLRKIIIILVSGFTLFFALILIIGTIISVSRPKVQQNYTLNKPSITQNSPDPEIPQTKTQKELTDLKNELNSLKFPPSELTTPPIEVGIDMQ
ncbi:hypothetical protein ISR94_03220 [Candidatus Microgenomates bacterium]|nr:hypothetical protein [Candidatus Microgenomates bacterium]